MFELTRRPKTINRLRAMDLLGKELDEFGNLVDSVFHFHGIPTLSGLGSPSFLPSLEFTEEKNKYVISVELPGLLKKDIDISLNEEGTLIIKGEKKQENKEEESEFYVCERCYGSFRREIPLPADIKKDEIEASFDKGVLILSLPKEINKEKTCKKIEIKKDS